MLRFSFPKLTLGLFGLLFATAGFALAPHEILVLVNTRDPTSVEVANHFVHARHIPARHVIPLALPANPDRETISPADFTRWIWAPVQHALAERGLEKHILAWVYSAGFPTTVSTGPGISITGMTFLRNRVPAPREVSAAAYRSPLFCGPDRKGGPSTPARSFSRAREALGSDMPLPSMMLGYTGLRGNETRRVNEVIRRGGLSDGTRPPGTVYFVSEDDPRFTTRLWQMLEARDALLDMGIDAKIVNHMPTHSADRIAGLMTGAQLPDLTNLAPVLPGAMCDHLTSLAACFQTPLQTKTSAWFDAGATVSSGTVTEPYALWAKFPHARYFVHSAHGCSAMESFYQSVRSPLQLLMLGEPLSRPYGKIFSLQLRTEGASVHVSVDGLPPDTVVAFVYLLDGRMLASDSPQPAYTARAESLSPGGHEWQVIAVAAGPVAHYAEAAILFQHAPERGSLHWVTVDRAPPGGTEALHVAYRGPGEPSGYVLLKHSVPLMERPGGASQVFPLNTQVLGKGPSRLVVEALVNGTRVRSVPVTVFRE